MSGLAIFAKAACFRRRIVGLAVIAALCPIGISSHARADSNEDAYAYVWKLYGQDPQRQIDELGKKWLTPGGLTDAERLQIARGPDSAKTVLGNKFTDTHICRNAENAIPETEKKRQINRSPVYYWFGVACSRAEQRVIAATWPVIAGEVRAAVAGEKQRGEKQASEDAQKRRAAAPGEAVALLKQYPIRWELSEKVDEMSGARVIAARSDQKADGGAPGMVRVEIQCQAKEGRKATVTEVTSFAQRGDKLVVISLPNAAQVRLGSDAPTTTYVSPSQYRNVGTLPLDWSRWGEYAIVRVQLELDGGPVVLRIVPFDGAVRKALEACGS